MTLIRKIEAKIREKVLVLCGVLFVLLPTSPMNMPLTYRDSGVFLYVGWRILNGELPYRDIWDHKPPIIFYIDALGLFVSNNSRWGVWLIEFFSLTLAGMISFYLIKKAFGIIPSTISLLLWLLTLVFLIQGGNLTTEYTLPLQFAALWLIYDINKPGISPWQYFLIGLIGAIAFFTKQTSVGIWIAIIFYLTFQRLTSRQVKQWSRELFFLFAGSLALASCIIIFFSAQNALPQFWNVAFRYNFFYSSTVSGFINRVQPLVDGLKPLVSTGLFQLSMMGYVFTITIFFFKRSIIEKQLPLLVIGLIDLPIELILISTSGNTLPHYYMTILPVFSLFTGIIFWVYYSQISNWGKTAKYVFTIGTIGVLIWSSLGSYIHQVIDFRNAGNGGDEAVINYIRATTTPDEYVLLLGNEALINYFAKRKSPSRFVYQWPLYTKGYTNEQIIEEFLNDTIQNPPQLIIDTPDLSFSNIDFPIHTKAIKKSIVYIHSHYRMAINLGPYKVYKYLGNNP